MAVDWKQLLLANDIGSSVQAFGDVLDDLNTLGAVASDGQFVVGAGAGAFVYESGNTARTSLGLGTENTVQFANFEAANKITACATNAGALDFSAASKALTVEDDAIVSQDYSNDGEPTFGAIGLNEGGTIGVASGTMRIDSNGVVGVYPEAAGIAIQAIYNGNTVYEQSTTGAAYWFFPGSGRIDISTPGNYPGFIFYRGAAGDENRFDFYNLGTHFRASYNEDGATGALEIIPGGKVGIGVITSDYMFEVATTAKIGTALTVGALSGVLKASTGLISGSATMDDITNGDTYGKPTLTQISNWDAAYGWGDHSAGGYQAQGDVLDDLNVLGANAADNEFLVGTGAGALAWESGAAARTSIGLGTGNSPTFAAASLGTGKLTCGSINGASGNFYLQLAGATSWAFDPTYVSWYVHGSYGGLNLYNYYTSGSGLWVIGHHARGTQAEPLASASGDKLFEIHGKGYVGSTDKFKTAGGIIFKADGTPADNPYQMPGRIEFYTAPAEDDTNSIERMRIDKDGNVGINRVPAARFHIAEAAIDVTSTGFGWNNTIVAEGTDEGRTLGLGGSIGFANPATIVGGNPYVQSRIIGTPDNNTNNNTSGRLYLQVRNHDDVAFRTGIMIRADGGVYAENTKSGATQAAAGTAANELWRTNGHATLPDGVVMIHI